MQDAAFGGQIVTAEEPNVQLCETGSQEPHSCYLRLQNVLDAKVIVSIQESSNHHLLTRTRTIVP